MTLDGLVGRRVSVHLNLTTKLFVVADKPKTTALATVACVTLDDVTFKVSEAQRLYCIRKGGRWVHAWALGTVAGFEPTDTTELLQVTYNPFRAPTFHVAGREAPLLGAPRVHFADRHGWVGINKEDGSGTNA